MKKAFKIRIAGDEYKIEAGNITEAIEWARRQASVRFTRAEVHEVFLRVKPDSMHSTIVTSGRDSKFNVIVREVFGEDGPK